MAANNLLGLTTEQMYGKGAIHIPINFIVQKVDDEGRVTGVFQTSAGTPLLFGSKKTHQMILGDAIIRPRLVCESDEFQGSGLSSLACSGFLEHENWFKGGVIFGREALQAAAAEYKIAADLVTTERATDGRKETDGHAR